MNLVEILLVSFSVSLDAFSVSIIASLEFTKLKEVFSISFYFGLFQFLMPLIGYLLGYSINNLVAGFGTFISFIILFIIGINMIKNDEIEIKKNVLLTSFAVSIDALSIGISYLFSYGSKNAIICFIMMGIITFINSIIGCYLGKQIENKINIKTNYLSGIILIIIGLKIIIEYFFLK